MNSQLFSDEPRHFVHQVRKSSASCPPTGRLPDLNVRKPSGSRPVGGRFADGFRTLDFRTIPPFSAQLSVRSSTHILRQTLTLNLLYTCRLHVDRNLVSVQVRESHEATRVCVYSGELAWVERNLPSAPGLVLRRRPTAPSTVGAGAYREIAIWLL